MLSLLCGWPVICPTSAVPHIACITCAFKEYRGWGADSEKLRPTSQNRQSGERYTVIGVITN
jgi:hypothetical protein